MCRGGLTALGRRCPNGCPIENQRDLYRTPTLVVKEFPKALLMERKKALTPLQRAHWDWCDAVLAAQTDAGALDPPDVLLSFAIIQLIGIVSNLTEKKSG
jgi:hypothetical protein